SKHPIDRVGCTVCHEGMGQSVSFRDAAHMPSNEKQKEEWDKKYHWEEPHLWDYPMLPVKMTEASCAKCHKQQVFVPGAEKMDITAIAAYLFANAGKHEFAVKNPPRGDAAKGEQIVKSIGCQGCHVVGEGARAEVGPRRTFGQPLENIGNKTTYEWIYNWV